jgi:DNA topoisomerase-6 subunit B
MTKTRSAGVDSRQARLFAAAAAAPRGSAARKRTKTDSGGAKLKAVPGASAPRRRAKGQAGRENAQTMAARQREISVSEFFTKNRHLLGFDNPRKALLTTVKEAVDNSLDACEEAGILPDLEIEISEVAENRFRIAVQDNGPGIVRQQVPKIFGKLLYGSKFHRLKQQRGQQGIGISAAGMYGQLTTGRPTQITSRTGKHKPAHRFHITVDTKKNAPVIQKDQEVEWDVVRGTRVEIELEAVYKKGRRSVDDYVEQTALANPHVRIDYRPPKDEPRLFGRVTQDLPKEAREIQPHPYGIELGVLLRMMKETPARQVKGMLTTEFSRVSAGVAERICQTAGVSPTARPSRLTGGQVEQIFHAIPKVKIIAPPTACLSPIGDELLCRVLEQRLDANYFSTVTRPPAVYRGNPFQVEVGLAYGGNLAADEPVELYRYANRVPLQYQQSACAISKSAVSTDWRKYGLQQSRGALPAGPMIVLVHIVMEAGRRVGAYVRKRKREADEFKKRSYIEKYIPYIGEALQEILGFSDRRRDTTVSNLKTILERSRKL